MEEQQVKPEPSDRFNDIEGAEWHPILTTPALMKTCRSCGITMGSLLGMNINLGDIPMALWYACEWQAKERKVSQDDFFARVGVSVLPAAMRAFWVAVRKAFPQLADMQLPQMDLAELAKRFGVSFGSGKSGI